MTPIPDHHFDRGKIFYPYVVNYIINLQGILEISSSALFHTILRDKKETELIELIHSIQKHIIRLKNELNVKGEPAIMKFLPNLSIESIGFGKRIEVDASLIYEEFFNNLQYILEGFIINAGSVLITTYEISHKKFYIKGNPVWNFFYHCRNASAHGGKLNITTKDPNRFPATWRGIEIKKNMTGLPLFKTPINTNGLLDRADLISLLWDIEQMHPDMKVL